MPITFPSSPSNGQTYTVGARTWTWSGSVWELNANTTGVESVSTNELANNAVTTAKIAAGAVEESDIASSAVTEAKIASNAVTAAKIASGAVTSSKLGNSLTLSGSPIFGNGSLSTTATSRTDFSADFGTTANGDSLIRSLFRESNGSSWETASWLLQRRVDVTNQSFVRFANGYIALGYASSNMLIADSSGRVYAPSQPYVHAFIGGANYTWTSGTNTIPFNNTLENTGSHFNTANHTFTCPVAGRYLVIATCQLASEATGSWSYNLHIDKNGSGQAGTYETGVAGRQYNKAHISGVITCSANDTLRIRVIVNQSTSLEGAGDMRNRLFITLL